jgi:hypothetical protein
MQVSSRIHLTGVPSRQYNHVIPSACASTKSSVSHVGSSGHRGTPRGGRSVRGALFFRGSNMFRPPSLAPALALVVWLTAAVSAPAWGVKGHIIVASIAERHLSQKAKAAVKARLGNQRLPDVANWADQIIYLQQYKTISQMYPDNNLFHFVDIPVEAENATGIRDIDGGKNVVVKLDFFKKEMTDNPDKTKQQHALRFVVHFAGDMHQPLHCAVRDNDRGGNKVHVHYPGDTHHTFSLHHVWDDNLVDEAMQTLTMANFIDRLDADITDEQIAAWKQGTTDDWAWETHKLAVEKAYKKADGTPIPKASEGVFTLEPKYVSDNAQVVRGQLQKAGIRLAAVLNDAFK